MSYSSSHWRNVAAPLISAAIAKHGKEDTPELRKALRDAYPFGERKMHPYKIWCDEVQIQTGRKRGKIAAEQDRNATLFKDKANA